MPQRPPQRRPPTGLRGRSFLHRPSRVLATNRPASDADPAISAILTRLEALPEMAVSDHLDVYTRLHDDLRDALNEDVTADTTEGKDASR